MQRTRPPQTGMAPSARLVPPLRTVMGKSYSLANLTMSDISWAFAGDTATSGMWNMAGLVS